MNNRIKELLNRSGGEFYEGFLGSPNTIKFTEEELKTFAELIVEEMYDFIMEESAKDNGIPDLGKVKEHFGVEE